MNKKIMISGIVVAIIIAITVGVMLSVGLKSSDQPKILLEKPQANQIKIQKAKNFDVMYEGENKILIDGAGRKVVLTHNMPISKDQIRIPVERMIIFSSTHAAFIDRLEITDKIVGVAWGGNYVWYIQGIKNGLASGKIKDIGIGNNPNYDEIVSLKPDLVVLVGGEGLWEKQAKKLDELGIPYVVNSEWLENDAFGRFEWIKFFSLFVDKEDEAVEIYETVQNKSDEIFASVSESSTPKVSWAGVFQGSAHVPKAESYVGQALKNANSDYALSDLKGTGGAQISLEEFISKASDSDVLIYSSHAVDSIKDIVQINPVLSSLKPLQTCRAYAFEPWYWQQIDRLDDFVNDIAAILHPEIFEGYELRQFKKLNCD